MFDGYHLPVDPHIFWISEAISCHFMPFLRGLSPALEVQVIIFANWRGFSGGTRGEAWCLAVTGQK